MKILIADDDKALVQALKKGLNDAGFEVVSAHDAVQTWVNTMRHVPAAVLLDLQMPGGSGVSVLRKMKMSAKTRDIPVLVITGSQDATMIAQAKELGAEYVLPKPVGAAQVVPLLRKLAGGLGAAPQRAPGAALRVLVADDDATNRRIVEVMLAKWGYVVESVSDGEQAWEVLQRPEPPSLAVLDWAMPGIQGVELCRRLRECPSDSYTYVILLTAKGQKADLVAGMEAGADDYIVKPFDAEELRVRIAAGRRILDLQDDLLAARAALQQRTRTAEPAGR